MRLFREKSEVRFPDRQYEVIRAGDAPAVRVGPGPVRKAWRQWTLDADRTLCIQIDILAS